LIGWCAAALSCKARDQWIGWPACLQYSRLPLLDNNCRFLILPPLRIPNLASRILSLNLKRLSQDWFNAYGHSVCLAETFVDPARFKGTCYKAAGWAFVGHILGFRRASRRYVLHGQPKMVFVRPLHQRAREILGKAYVDSNPSLEVKAMKRGWQRRGEARHPEMRQVKSFDSDGHGLIALLVFFQQTARRILIQRFRARGKLAFFEQTQMAQAASFRVEPRDYFFEGLSFGDKNMLLAEPSEALSPLQGL